MAPRPWLVHERHVAFDCPWYHVVRERVELGDGATVDYYTGAFPDVALVLALTAANQIVFVRQYKHGARQVLLELPGGALDVDEHPERGAARELREETGYSGDDFRALGTFYGNPTKERGNVLHVYRLIGATCRHEPVRDSSEEIEVCLVPIRIAYNTRFLQDIRVAGTRLALELARPDFQRRGLID